MVRAWMFVGLALLSSTDAGAAWQQASSAHFVVYSNDTPENVRAYTARLERFDRAVRVLRGIPEDRRGPASRVTVFVLDNVDQIQKLAPRNSNAAGFYRDRVEGPVAFVPRKSGEGSEYDLKPEQILLHEYTHHIMYNDWPTAVFPKWFSEGFAEFHATAIFGKDGSVTFGAPPVYRSSGVARRDILPIHDMLLSDPARFTANETYVLYSRGWALTHYLTFDPDRRKQLGAYVDAVTSGKPARTAAAVFGNPDQLDLRVDSYLRQRALPALTVAAADLEIGAVTERALTGAEAAMMPARIRSSNGVDARTAPAVLALARTEAAPFPTDAAAQNELAEAELDAGDAAASEAAADRALAADPRSVHATLYKGMAMEAAATAAKKIDPATWAGIRRWYGAANKLDVDDPQPLVLYYRTFAAAGQQPSHNAEEGLLYAYALAPSALDLRLLAAQVYLRRNDAVKAREAMLPVAYSEHGGSYAARVRDTIATLDKDGAPAALAVLGKKDKAAAPTPKSSPET